jgi:NADH dehydrogenase (ubiquinone) 1 beta subcomplex subunit 3
MGDPWARFDAWRASPDVSLKSNVRRIFPGLGLGTLAFVIAVAIEKKSTPASDHH